MGYYIISNLYIACSGLNNKVTLISSPASSASSSIISLEWLTILIFSILSLTLLLLFTLLLLRIRHRYLHKKNKLYYKCAQLTNTTKNSSIESDHNQLARKNNYDDLTSMGSYIYPITSTTSLLHTSSPSSVFKSEQYAIIDPNSYAQCSMNNVRRKKHDELKKYFC